VNVRFRLKAAAAHSKQGVRFTPESCRDSRRPGRPLAISGHRPASTARSSPGKPRPQRAKTRNRKQVGTRIRTTGRLPAGRAARGSTRATDRRCGLSSVAPIWLTEAALHCVMRWAAVPRTPAWGRRVIPVAWGWRRRIRIRRGWRRRIPVRWRRRIHRRRLGWKLRPDGGGRPGSQYANSAKRENSFHCGPHGAALSLISQCCLWSLSAVYRALTTTAPRTRETLTRSAPPQQVRQLGDIHSDTSCPLGLRRARTV
jgi:hypothetical protein